MAVISSLILTNTNPVVTYTASVVTSGSILADGLGNQLTSLQVTASHSDTSSLVFNSTNISMVACDNPSVTMYLHVSQSGLFNWNTTPN